MVAFVFFLERILKEIVRLIEGAIWFLKTYLVQPEMQRGGL